MSSRTEIPLIRSVSSEETSPLESGHAELKSSGAGPARDSSSGVRVTAPPDFNAVYDHYGKFVWLMLQRLGVRHRDLDDLCHDVFVVVHERLPSFADRTNLRSWLFAICARVAANYRRRAPVRLEHAIGAFEDTDRATPSAPESSSPERLVLRDEEVTKAQAILARMPALQRTVFLMFEVEGIPCEEIARDLGVPLGTIYSRLHAARNSFQRAARKLAQSEGT
jgi:RNA polymerase sigma-70 factor (ECF subfamily)